MVCLKTGLECTVEARYLCRLIPARRVSTALHRADLSQRSLRRTAPIVFGRGCFGYPQRLHLEKNKVNIDSSAIRTKALWTTYGFARHARFAPK
jgi:hypothetical protein